MAVTTIVELVDDIDGTPGAHRTVFSLNNKYFAIDLNDQHTGELARDFEKWIALARPVQNPAHRRHKKDRDNATAIRTWARKEGMEVGTHGRIPVDIRNAYNNRNTR